MILSPGENVGIAAAARAKRFHGQRAPAASPEMRNEQRGEGRSFAGASISSGDEDDLPHQLGKRRGRLQMEKAAHLKRLASMKEKGLHIAHRRIAAQDAYVMSPILANVRVNDDLECRAADDEHAGELLSNPRGHSRHVHQLARASEGHIVFGPVGAVQSGARRNNRLSKACVYSWNELEDLG